MYDNNEKLYRIEKLIEDQKSEQEELRKKQEREMGLALAYWDKSALSHWLRQNARRFSFKHPLREEEKRDFVSWEDLWGLNIDVKIWEHSHKKIDLKKYEEKMFSSEDIIHFLESVRNFMNHNWVEIDKEIDYREATDWDKSGYNSEAWDILKGILFGTYKPNEGRYYLKDWKLLVCDFDRFYICDSVWWHPKALLLKNEK